MRKQDYSLLANLIKIELDLWRPMAGEYAKCHVEFCEKLARGFAQNASVKKDDFLAACGIKL